MRAADLQPGPLNPRPATLGLELRTGAIEFRSEVAKLR
jgi:hypothetical protein